jgi:hypothetical protein
MNHVVAGHAVDSTLALVLSLASLATAILAGLGLTVFLRRRSRSYLLVAFALVALFTRTAIAVLAMLGVLSQTPHHLVEHGLDAIVAALVVGAVYSARTARRPRTVTRERLNE